MEENKMKFTETVMLIDATFIDNVACDMRRHFTSAISREIPKGDIALLIECLALEGGVKPADNAIQVLFIYNQQHSALESFTPSSLDKELNNVAFKGNLGEFSLFSFQPSDMVTTEELFSESMKVVLDCKEVKNVILVPSQQLTSAEIDDTVTKVDGKDSITVLGMNPMQLSSPARWETMGYAVMKSLGIKADEI